MSRIITPVDILTITVDNRGASPQATLKTSRELPAAQIIDLLLMLAVQLNRDQAARMGLTGAPAVPPPGPKAVPPAGTDGNGAA